MKLSDPQRDKRNKGFKYDFKLSPKTNPQVLMDFKHDLYQNFCVEKTLFLSID